MATKKELQKMLTDALTSEGDIPEWKNNHKFNKPDDGMEMDIAFVEFKVGIEVNGGQWSTGKMGHNSGVGVERDARKGNWANLKGWSLYNFVTDHIEKEMETYTIPTIRKALLLVGAPIKNYDTLVKEMFEEPTSWITKEEDDGKTSDEIPEQ